MRRELLVSVNDLDLVVYENKVMMASEAWSYAYITNQSIVVTVLESADEVMEFENQTIPHLGPQAITIFVPNFQTKKVMLRSMIFSDDWVADCQDMDRKYKIWFTSMHEALAILGRELVLEV